MEMSGISLGKLQQALTAALVCETCGKSTSVANLAGHRQPQRLELVSPESHCACPGGPAYAGIGSTFCQGCGEMAPLTAGKIQPRFMPGTIETVEYCAACWTIVDNADPTTGAYGAACCDVRRADAPLGSEPLHVDTIVEFEGERVRFVDLSVQDRKAYLAGGYPF